MDFGLKGKRVLVLAASRGLGFGSAKAIAAEGAELVIVGRNAGTLDQAAAEISNASGVKPKTIVADLTSPGAGAAVFKAAVELMGGIDVLVNNTGGPPAKLARDVTADDIRAQLNGMVANIIEVTHLALSGMRERKWGRIITVASSGTIAPIPNLALSNALRASVVGYMKTLAAEVAAEGITVNIVLPGRIQTQRVDELDAVNAKREGKPVEDIRKSASAAIPAGRYGTADEFGAAVCFLASTQASYITGSQIRVDGGAVRSV